VRVRVVGVVCAVAVILSGCAGSGGEGKPPLTNATGSAVESNAVVMDEPTESVPVYVPLDQAEVGDVVQVEVPVKPEPSAAMAVNDEAGARAAVRYFYDVINYTVRSPEPDLVVREGSSDCNYCKQFSEVAGSIAQRGQRAAEDGQVLKEIEAVRRLSENSWIASTVSNYTNAVIVNQADEVVLREDGLGVMEDQMILDFDSGQWTLAAFGERGL